MKLATVVHGLLHMIKLLYAIWTAVIMHVYSMSWREGVSVHGHDEMYQRYIAE